MAQDSWRVLDPDLAVEQVQVGTAHATRQHLQQQLSGTRPRHRPLHCSQRPARPLEDHRLHELM
jgi:hypothetical protein